jgi:CubicO group peptidase (beta-lactamase class C family)
MASLAPCVARLARERHLIVAARAGATGLVIVLALVVVAPAGAHLSTLAPTSTSLRGKGTPRSNSINAIRVESSEVAGQSALSEELDAALRTARVGVRAPAATAAVVACGRVVWAGATGVLDLASKRPASNSSLFILNSTAKTIVATMIMQEVQAGQLSLSDRLSEFYPKLPNSASISVRMLLNMTSGLPDYLLNRPIEWTIQHRPRHRWTVNQVLTGLGTGLGPAEFRPGHEYQYSDTNYIVLGAILERITHSSIQSDFQRLITKPLGITSATFLPTPTGEALLAHPYLLQSNGLLSSQWIPGFGVSSADWGPGVRRWRFSSERA